MVTIWTLPRAWNEALNFCLGAGIGARGLRSESFSIMSAHPTEKETLSFINSRQLFSPLVEEVTPTRKLNKRRENSV